MTTATTHQVPGQDPAVSELIAHNRRLQAENSALKGETEELWSVVRELRSSVDELKQPAPAPVQPMPPAPAEDTAPGFFSRRRLLQAGTAATAGAVAAAAGVAVVKPGEAAAAFSATGVPLTQFMTFEGTPTIPALDSDVVWARQSTVDPGPGHTQQVLSLIEESAQVNAFLWPLYVQVKGTSHPSATQATSQSSGAQVRAFNRSPGGTPWVTGFHSEMFHGANDTIAGSTAYAANGTSILFNGELYRRVANGRAIGLNLQNVGGYAGQHGDEAINVQGDWQTGLRFEAFGARSGTRGIWLEHNFDVGIDLADNCLRMNGYIGGGGGSPGIFLEESRAISIRWNKTTQHIEFCWGSTVLCYVSLNRANVNLNP
jgi:hypothetical protein